MPENVKICSVVPENSLLIGRPLKNKKTRNAWQIQEYNPLGVVVLHPSEYL